MDRDSESLVGLPGEKHLSPCILGEVSWSVLRAVFPLSQVLKEFLQELKPVAKFSYLIYKICGYVII